MKRLIILIGFLSMAIAGLAQGNKPVFQRTPDGPNIIGDYNLKVNKFLIVPISNVSGITGGSVDSAGYFRYNPTTKQFEGYYGPVKGWQLIGGAAAGVVLKSDSASKPGYVTNVALIDSLNKHVDSLSRRFKRVAGIIDLSIGDSTATSANNFAVFRNSNGDLVLPNINFSTSNNTVIYNGIKINANGGLQTNAPLKSGAGTFLKQNTSTGLVEKDTVTYQPLLVSGTNIKTINSNSLLGSGNIPIPTIYTADDSIHTTDRVVNLKKHSLLFKGYSSTANMYTDILDTANDREALLFTDETQVGLYTGNLSGTQTAVVNVNSEQNIQIETDSAGSAIKQIQINGHNGQGILITDHKDGKGFKYDDYDTYKNGHLDTLWIPNWGSVKNYVTGAIAGGAPPSGTAGGDLSGTFPSPTVAKFNGQLPSYYLNYANLTGTPSALPPNGSAGGELSGTFPNPTLSNSAVIGKVLTGFISGAGTVASTDNILQAFQKINGNVAANTSSIATNTTNIASNTTAIATKLAASNFVYGETPSGSINSSNTSFTLANTPTTGTVKIYRNGLRQKVGIGAGTDYTISGSTITYNYAPTTGDSLIADYQK